MQRLNLGKKLLFTVMLWCFSTVGSAAPVENSVMVEIDTIEMTEDKVENVIAEPIEILLGSLDGVFMVSAKYSENRAVINVKFSELSDDSEALVSKVKATIGSYMDKLPDSIESISVSLGEPSEPVGPVVNDAAESSGPSQQEDSAARLKTVTEAVTAPVDNDSVLLNKPGVIISVGKRSIAGRYLGSIESSNEFLPIITTLLPGTKNSDSVSMGKYFMSESDAIVNGELSDCYKNLGNVLTCQWRDKYGMGGVDLIFTPDYASFNGRWSINGQEGAYKWSGIKVKDAE